MTISGGNGEAGRLGARVYSVTEWTTPQRMPEYSLWVDA
jgi:hypothetical protein